MLVLGIDVGSSSVKAGVLRNRKLVGRVARVAFGTDYDGERAEVSADAILRAVARAVADVGALAVKADVIAISAMAASWVAMDKRGRAITRVVTHQDRRSVGEAHQLLRTFGKQRLLRLTGNLPFPGGISSTTWAWFNRHERSLMRRKADLVGHVQTLLHRQLSASRVVDPSHASFMGLYDVLGKRGRRGWSEGVCAAVGATEHQLPQLVESDGVVGLVTRAAGTRFGLTHGTPVLCGCIDTSAAMFLCGAAPGQLLNVSGSTDVLSLCTDRPVPHERLLTRALGTGERWMSVSTIAAAGSALNWAKEQLFADVTDKQFYALVRELAKDSKSESAGVTFEPYLAGDRTSVEQRRASFTGVTLATTRRQLLAAVIESLARASAERVELLRKTNRVRIDRHVVVSGGVQSGLHALLHRDWPGKWTFKIEEEATLRGLAALADPSE